MAKIKKAEKKIITPIIENTPVVNTKNKLKKKKIKKISPPNPITENPVIVVEPDKIEIPKIENEHKKDDKIKPETVIFYGHNIRSIYMNSQWYFSLEDILKICNIVDPTKFLVDLKNQTDLKDEYYKIVETFSYYENDNPIIIAVVKYQSFIQLLPHIRQTGSVLPGPFPDWLKNTANRSF